MILFISNMDGVPWGGSEELWARAAILLAGQGMSVAASVHGWPQLDGRIIELLRAGVDVRPRPSNASLFVRARRYFSRETNIIYGLKQSFGQISPKLVVISSGEAFPPIELSELCVAKCWPFVTVAQLVDATSWPSDEIAARLRRVLPLAQRCFYVSEANRVLAEKQLGYGFNNAEVVRNPIIVELASPIPWPSNNNGDQELRIACVARLYPAQKGQDILLDILASPLWMERKWRLTFYGSGPNRDVLERLVERLTLRDRVSFAGHVTVEKIWSENHILVVPSHCEAGPMTTVEAMWYGRPVVGTNVGINPEIIKDGVTGFLAEAAVAECFGAALERMWLQRERLQEIGKSAATYIREFMPNDPVGSFARKIEQYSQSLMTDKLSGA
jgi:glycosyltransferase involved in cell wall biosynthesis